MSYLLPHLHTGWHVDQAIMSEDDRVVVIRFGRDWDKECMKQDEVLYRIADKCKNFAVFYLVDIDEVPDFNKMYELYDASTQQGLCGAADRHPAHLGVEHDRARLGRIGGGVDIGVANAFEMGNDGMRLSRCTRSISERPPRGTITSIELAHPEHQPDRRRGRGWHRAGSRYRVNPRRAAPRPTPRPEPATNRNSPTRRAGSPHSLI